MGLDNLATTCYIDNSLLSELGYYSTLKTIELTTMENRLSPVSVGVVKDLKILSLCQKKYYIVPTLYAKNDWPFETDDSQTRKDIENFDNLLKLSFNFIDAKIDF